MTGLSLEGGREGAPRGGKVFLLPACQAIGIKSLQALSPSGVWVWG